MGMGPMVRKVNGILHPKTRIDFMIMISLKHGKTVTKGHMET